MFGRIHARFGLLRTAVAFQSAEPTAEFSLATQIVKNLTTSAPEPSANHLEQEALSKTFRQQSPAVNNPPAAPWTPTDQLRKRKHLTKRMGHLMQVLEREQVDADTKVKTFPRFAAGDSLEIKTAVPENQRREAIFKGLCIARTWRGWRSTFTVRNFITGGGGIERTFQLYAPHLLQVKVIKSMPTRRAKLYYMRKRQPREYRV